MHWSLVNVAGLALHIFHEFLTCTIKSSSSDESKNDSCSETTWGCFKWAKMLKICQKSKIICSNTTVNNSNKYICNNSVETGTSSLNRRTLYMCPVYIIIRPEMTQKHINMQIYERDNGFKETWPMGIFKRKYLSCLIKKNLTVTWTYWQVPCLL